VNLHHTRFLIALALVLSLGGALASCEESSSSIGLQYYSDTVAYKTDTVGALSPVLTWTPTSQPKIVAGSRTFNLTWASPLMLVGRSKQGTEDVESWGVLRFLGVGSDTLSKTTAVRLLLHTIQFKYGLDSANSNVDFQIYAQRGGGTITDSSTSINTTELTTTPVASFTGSLIDSTGTLVSIPLDSAEIPKLIATSYAFVIEPGPTMNHARGFATSDATSALVPLIEYTVQTDTGIAKITRPASLDMHVVKDASQLTAGEFELRGSLGTRMHLDLDMRRIQDSLGLTRFSTVNSAVLELHADLANTRISNIQLDTAGPTIVRLTGTTDSATAYYGAMTHDPARPDVYTITFGNLLELWLRDPSSYHGIDLRAGWNNRLFISTLAGVEDNTLNRWSFYGPNATDPAKRPRVFISHSTLK
jgi:hypothetical protein